MSSEMAPRRMSFFRRFFVVFTRLIFAMPAPLEKSLQAGLRPAEDEGMHVMRALIGVDRLEIYDMADDMIFVGNAVAAMHVARGPRNV